MNTSVKSFNEFELIGRVNGGFQWMKKYQDGDTAKVVIYKSRVSRADVDNAFFDQEFGAEMMDNYDDNCH